MVPEVLVYVQQVVFRLVLFQLNINKSSVREMGEWTE